MQVQTLSEVTHINETPPQLVFTTAEAEARVSVYSAAVIRIQITRQPQEPDHSFAVIQSPSTDKLQYHDDGATMELSTSALKLIIHKAPLRFSFYTAGGKPLNEDDRRYGVNWQGERVINYKKLYADEKFIGLGEKTGPLNRRGKHYVNWNSDVPNHTPESDPLYETFPFYIGLHDGLTYGLFFDNTHKSYFDFGASTDEQMSWFGADGGDLNYYFFGAQSVAQIIQDYTWLTGRMEMPPLWSLGYQQCRWSYMSAQEVLEVAENFRKYQIPADVLYCDIDYMEDFKIFTWNKQTFPEPKAMIDRLKAMNFNLVTIVDPGIKVEKGYPQYDEGVDKGYFATYPDGEKYIGEVWPGRCHFPNFFNEEVCNWWGASFNALTEPGVTGFWNDMNEPAVWNQNMPWLVKFGDKYMPEVRNVYGMEMARATYEGTRKTLGNQRPFVLTRAAYSGTQRYSAVWTGDNTANDEHLLLGQRLVNSLGVTGMAMVGVDIGGFSGNPTPELMVRWNSLGVYTPMFRNHAQEGTIYREPWQWGEDNMAIIKKDIELRYRLLPYIYSGYYQSAQTGLPLSRTLAINYTQDEQVYEEVYQNEFEFGDSMLVAPVISTANTADVYLPEGQWYRFNTGEQYAGGQNYTVAAPLTDLPVFVKAGAIIPMQGVVQSTKDAGDGILELHIWNGDKENSFVYYEDDGQTYDYQQGSYYKRTIHFNPAGRQIDLSAVEGSYLSKYASLKLVMHGYDELTSSKFNDQPIVFNFVDNEPQDELVITNDKMKFVY
ncbi:glycoside hydrolase family 31 protein [Mucilaginibacter sp.]